MKIAIASLLLSSACMLLSTSASAGEKETMNTENNKISVSGPTPGDTVVARWKDNKQAVFMMFFDDGCHSHLEHAIPLLSEYGIVGTFYVCPGWDLFKKDAAAWDEAAKKPEVEIANHTMSHAGAPSAEKYEKDMVDCSKYILDRFPPSPTSPLVSYGKPGVASKDWKISKEEHKAIIAKAGAVMRPGIDGAVVAMHVKTMPEIEPLVRKALETGGEGLLLFHGVGGDWLSCDLKLFKEILDLLASHKNEFWFAGHIAEHKYKTERDGARVEMLVSDKGEIRVKLSSSADPKLYDHPLTLLTRMPPDWKACTVEQDGKKTVVEIKNGQAMYDVMPGKGQIRLTPSAPPVKSE